MKTICRLPDFDVPNVSIYLFDDTVSITIDSERTVVGDPDNPELIILDCNTSNCVLYVEVPNPDEWYGWKYTFTPEQGWALNPDWTPPTPPPEPQIIG
jgi:hypothetical protein